MRGKTLRFQARSSNEISILIKTTFDVSIIKFQKPLFLNFFDMLNLNNDGNEDFHGHDDDIIMIMKKIWH